jgi:hypothetical protein
LTRKLDFSILSNTLYRTRSVHSDLELISRSFHLGDVDLFHFQHRLGGTSCAIRVWVGKKVLGISPASERFVALTITRTFMLTSPFEELDVVSDAKLSRVYGAGVPGEPLVAAFD